MHFFFQGFFPFVVKQWILTKNLLLWLRPAYNEGLQDLVNMASTAGETSVSRYPSEETVKEALDMLKPPGILSKVSS